MSSTPGTPLFDAPIGRATFIGAVGGFLLALAILGIGVAVSGTDAHLIGVIGLIGPFGGCGFGGMMGAAGEHRLICESRPVPLQVRQQINGGITIRSEGDFGVKFRTIGGIEGFDGLGCFGKGRPIMAHRHVVRRLLQHRGPFLDCQKHGVEQTTPRKLAIGVC